jgi:CDP-diacylglycerol--serine O-phosphatidyltransferase
MPIDAALPRTDQPRGTFHLKDIFTMVNLISGVVAVHFVLFGQPRTAGFTVLVGYLFGDMLDGTVARLTNRSNRFGAELDSIVDHFVHVVVPSIILYTMYQNAGHELLGLVGLGVLVGTATIRHARLAAERFDFPLCWCGLPRTISGFAAMSLVLSQWGEDHLAHNPIPPFVVVVVLSVLNLAPIPYITHRGARGLPPWIKVGLGVFLLSPAVTFIFARDYTFDIFLIWMLGYALLGWLPISSDERQAFRHEYRRWSAALAR